MPEARGTPQINCAMEPKNERLGADEPESKAEHGLDDEDVSSPQLPPIPDLPHPPEVSYKRPPLKRGQYAARPDEHIGVSDAQNKINVAARIGSGLSAGITFASSVVVSVLIGMWLDHRFEPKSTTPWATVFMLIIGFIAGFMTFVRISSAAERNSRHRP